jgi:hypothetical protein
LTLNTSTPFQPLPLTFSLSPLSGGPLYRTFFNLSLNNTSTSSNLFTALHLLDLDDHWLPLSPWALNLNQMVSFSLPHFKRLRLEARDELGRYHAGDIRVDTWLEGDAKAGNQYMGEPTSWDEAVELVKGVRVECAEVRRRCSHIR